MRGCLNADVVLLLFHFALFQERSHFIINFVGLSASQSHRRPFAGEETLVIVVRSGCENSVKF